jgi:ABC-type lipoprotein export system ATPase subunit
MIHYFELKQVTPHPLVGVTDFNSQVWGKNLALKSSSRYLLYAPSGKGKSSFIHLLYGLRNDFQGEILIKGKSHAAMNSNEWAELRQHDLSIQFQDLRLFGDLTAQENLEVKLVLPQAVEKARVESWLSRLQIEHLVAKPAKHLSYGERQRFAIVRAMIQPFGCILLDEPFAHLDPENTRRACELIDERCRELNAGFILTSLHENQPLPYDEIIRL